MEKEFNIEEYIKQANKKTHKLGKDILILDEKFQMEEISNKYYNAIYKVGRGAYGCVVSATDLTEDDQQNNKVAIKKIENIFEHTIFAKRCLRELIISRLLQQNNIVQIKEVLIPEKEDFEDIYVVYELMETDLGAILKSSQILSNEHIQYFLYQILRGLKYIHTANIIHRDLVRISFLTLL
jgi:serine/threonine protein kinase